MSNAICADCAMEISPNSRVVSERSITGELQVWHYGCEPRDPGHDHHSFARALAEEIVKRDLGEGPSEHLGIQDAGQTTVQSEMFDELLRDEEVKSCVRVPGKCDCLCHRISGVHHVRACC